MMAWLQTAQVHRDSTPEPAHRRPGTRRETLSLEIALGIFDRLVEFHSVDNFIYFLYKCRKEKNLMSAQRLHAHVCNHGLELHAAVGNYIVPMFVECGNVPRAEQAFSRLVHRNVHSWTSLMIGYIQSGQSQHALNLYHKMQENSVHPNESTIVALLKACIRLKNAERGRDVHAEIAKKGFEGNLLVGNSLIDMYAKCGSLWEAQEVFDKLPVRDVVSWTALIAGYAEQGSGLIALKCFQQMQVEGVSPNAVTFICILKACASIGAIDKGREIHKDIKQKGLERDLVLGSTLVNMYAKCGLFLEAREVFNELPVRNIVSWTGLIAGYVENGHAREALECFEQMQLEDVSPDSVILVLILKACGSIGAIDKGRIIHVMIIEKGCERDPVVGNSLVTMYAKCGSLLEAHEVFDKLPVRDLVSWSALIAGYAEHGPGQEALKCFQQMQLEGTYPDAVTLVCILKTCGNIGAIDKGREVHGGIIQRGFERDPCIGSALVDMYAKCGSLSDAREAFDKLPVRVVASWNALILGYAEHGPAQEALDCFESMEAEGISPDAVTFVCILKACGSIGAINKGRELHIMITQRGFGRDPFVASALIDMYAKCSSLSEAQEVFDMLPIQDAA